MCRYVNIFPNDLQNSVNIRNRQNINHIKNIENIQHITNTSNARNIRSIINIGNSSVFVFNFRHAWNLELLKLLEFLDSWQIYWNRPPNLPVQTPTWPCLLFEDRRHQRTANITNAITPHSRKKWRRQTRTGMSRRRRYKHT